MVNQPSKKIIQTAVLLALANFTQSALAAEKTDIQLDPVEVTGILPEKLEAVPGSFDVIDEKELETRRPFTVKEALSNTPGINIVGEDAYSLRLNIGIRGLNPRRTSRTLLLEDGMPLFLAPYGDPSAHFSTPLDRVQRIEVVKGSGQILYGPQTVGGMINFVTKPVPTDGVHGSITGTLGTNDFGSTHANIGAGNERGGIMFDAIKKKGDGIRDNHDFDVQEYTLKGQLNINDAHTIIAKASYLDEFSHQSETALGTVEYDEDPYQAPTGRNDHFTHERQTAQIKHIFEMTDTAKLTTQAYYADSYRSSFRQINDPGENAGRSELERCAVGVDETNLANADQCGGRHRPRSYKYWGFEPRLDFSHSLFGLESDAVIGFRYHEEDIKRRQFRGNDPTGQSLSFIKANLGILPEREALLREDIRFKVEAQSYYAQNTFYAGDWSITPGLRFEDFKIKTDIRQEGGDPAAAQSTNRKDKLLPGLGVAWNGIANTTVFAGVHKGFAPPRPNRDIDDTNISNTKPEESVNWELGFRSNYYKGISVESTLFRTDLNDIVIQEQGGIFVNAGESEMSGIEIAGRVDFGKIYNTAHNFYISGSYTNLFTAKFTKDTNQTTSGNRLPYAPRDIASVNFGYEHPVGINARFGIDYVSSQYVDRDNTRVESIDGTEGKIPSYTLLNLSINYQPVNTNFSYFLSGYNLADKEYLMSRVDGKAAGRQRQVFGGVRYAF
jgi:Fe(3+) dicitrate transport protein